MWSPKTTCAPPPATAPSHVEHADFGYRPVAKLVVREATLNARVAGGDDCAVQRRNERGVPGHSCTCPLGGDRRSSKCAAAVGFVWLAHAGGWTENL